MPIGANIRRIRQEKGMVMRELAALLEVPESYVGAVERGEVTPGAQRILEFATALGVTPNDLYGIASDLPAAANQ